MKKSIVFFSIIISGSFLYGQKLEIGGAVGYQFGGAVDQTELDQGDTHPGDGLGINSSPNLGGYVSYRLAPKMRMEFSFDNQMTHMNFHDHQTGYGFLVSAAGVLQDWRIYNDGWSDSNWDGVWKGAAKMQPWGWSAEMEIPYHCLRFPDIEEQVWGLNFSRVINRRQEDSWWNPISNTESGFVSKFGHLTGLTGINPARRLEVLPYAVSSYETDKI